MKIINTRDYPSVPTINMLVYGRGGVGKSTFGATFPRVLFIDFENGVKYFNQRGIEVPVVQFQNFPTHQEQMQIVEYANANKFDSIVIDPIGEAMEKLIKDHAIISGQKYRQNNGDLTMAGWGKVKDEMRTFLKCLRDTGKNMVIIAHTNSVQDGEVIKERPLVATKLVDELIAMVDIVGYLDVVKDGETSKRIIRLNPADPRFDAKDRTGALPEIIKPEYAWITKQIKSSQNASIKKETPKDTTIVTEQPEVADVPQTEEVVQEIETQQENPFDNEIEDDMIV